MLAVRNDEELIQFLSNITIASVGIVPHIHRILLGPKKGESKDNYQE
jgi:histone H2A